MGTLQVTIFPRALDVTRARVYVLGCFRHFSMKAMSQTSSAACSLLLEAAGSRLVCTLGVCSSLNVWVHWNEWTAPAVPSRQLSATTTVHTDRPPT